MPVVRLAARIERRGRLLLKRIPTGKANAGLFEFPAITVFHGSRDSGPPPSRVSAPARRRFERRFATEYGSRLKAGPLIARVNHSITHHRIALLLLDGTLREPVSRGAPWAWLTSAQANDHAVTAATRKLLARL